MSALLRTMVAGCNLAYFQGMEVSLLACNTVTSSVARGRHHLREGRRMLTVPPNLQRTSAISLHHLREGRHMIAVPPTLQRTSAITRRGLHRLREGLPMFAVPPNISQASAIKELCYLLLQDGCRLAKPRTKIRQNWGHQLEAPQNSMNVLQPLTVSLPCIKSPMIRSKFRPAYTFKHPPPRTPIGLWPSPAPGRFRRVPRDARAPALTEGRPTRRSRCGTNRRHRQGNVVRNLWRPNERERTRNDSLSQNNFT